MGYIKKTIMPQFGLSMKEMAEGVKGYWGRRIFVRRSGVDVPRPYSVTDSLDAELPPQMIKSTKIHYGGSIITKEEEIPEGKICEGADVYYQLIELSLKSMKLTARSIIDDLIFHRQILPDAKWSRELIQRKINEMYEFGYLGMEEEKINWFTTIKRYFSANPVVTTEEMHDFVEGFEPVSYHILKFIEDEGGDGTNINKLRDEFISKRRWIRNNKELYGYLTYMSMTNSISIEGNKVKFKKPLPINVNVSKNEVVKVE